MIIKIIMKILAKLKIEFKKVYAQETYKIELQKKGIEVYYK